MTKLLLSKAGFCTFPSCILVLTSDSHLGSGASIFKTNNKYVTAYVSFSLNSKLWQPMLRPNFTLVPFKNYLKLNYFKKIDVLQIKAFYIFKSPIFTHLE